MTIYQKAVRARLICTSLKECRGERDCPYLKYCKKSQILVFSPQFQDLTAIANAIKTEKWIVKWEEFYENKF